MVKKGCIYALLLIAMLYGYRYLLHEGIRKNKNGVFHKFNEAFLKSTRYNVIFLGSSRAEMHFNPKIFDSLTQFKSYNLGISGASIRLSFSVLKVFCKKHLFPNYVVLNIDSYDFKQDSDVIYDFPRFFPYLENSFLRAELNKIDNRFNSFYYNPIHSLPYEQLSYLSSSLHGWLGISGRYDTLSYKGFQTAPSTTVFSNTKNKKEIYSTVDVKNSPYIDSLWAFAKQNHIHLLFTTSPIHHENFSSLANRKALLSQINQIAVKNNIEYWDYSADTNYVKKDNLFVDEYHLNREGAALFTKQFSQSFNKKYRIHP